MMAMMAASHCRQGEDDGRELFDGQRIKHDDGNIVKSCEGLV